jgi:MoxR-like ATPase
MGRGVYWMTHHHKTKTRRFILLFSVVLLLGDLGDRRVGVVYAGGTGGSCEQAFEQADEEAAKDLQAKEKAALQAGAAFFEYFKALRGNLKERGYLLDLVEQALIAKEGVLIMGPPGNAKSLLADMVLGNVLEEKEEEENGPRIHEEEGLSSSSSGSKAEKQKELKPSYYRIQMTPETTMSETHGPLDYKKLTEENKYVRLYEEGMLMSRNVFIDEIFDARANASRNILGVLAERAHSQGPKLPWKSSFLGR